MSSKRPNRCTRPKVPHLQHTILGAKKGKREEGKQQRISSRSAALQKEGVRTRQFNNLATTAQRYTPYQG